MIIAFAWLFSILAFLLLGLGLWLKDQTLGFAGATLILIMGLTILGLGVDYPASSAVTTSYSYQNATMELNATPYPSYVLSNMTRNETISYTPIKDNTTYALGLVYAIIGMYFLIRMTLDRLTGDKLNQG